MEIKLFHSGSICPAVDGSTGLRPAHLLCPESGNDLHTTWASNSGNPGIVSREIKVKDFQRVRYYGLILIGYLASGVYRINFRCMLFYLKI